MEMRRGFQDAHSAYQRVMFRRANPAVTSDEEEPAATRGMHGAVRRLSDFEKEALFQEWVKQALGTNPDKMDDEAYSNSFEAFKSHMFRAAPEESASPRVPRPRSNPRLAADESRDENDEEIVSGRRARKGALSPTRPAIASRSAGRWKRDRFRALARSAGGLCCERRGADGNPARAQRHRGEPGGRPNCFPDAWRSGRIGAFFASVGEEPARGRGRRGVGFCADRSERRSAPARGTATEIRSCRAYPASRPSHAHDRGVGRWPGARIAGSKWYSDGRVGRIREVAPYRNGSGIPVCA